ncbi:MAG TPA: SRPBCC family protein [Burkholderiaceae bacterium]|nr:SRPBCC family protein [Burkholderiaceae bacterium]
MKVTFEKVFAMPGAAATTWTLLQDIEAVTSCLPGARITARTDDTHYKGTVSVKFGPAALSFRGDVEVRELDAATRTLRLIGTGTDATGGSAATMDLTARVETVDELSSTLVGNSEVSMSGKAAAFGGRMIDSVADQILKQFAANLAAKVAALQAQQAATTVDAGLRADGVERSGRADGGEAPGAAPGASARTSMPSAAPSTAARSVPQSPTAPPPATIRASPEARPADEPASLDGFALMWAVFKSWLRDLFSARKT